MLKERADHIIAIKKLARALGHLNNQVVFVGGATISLYIDEPGAPDIRPTFDIDMVVNVASSIELEHLRQKLQNHNVHPAADSDIICRFRYKDILLDIMSTQNVSWAPANPWFKVGYENRKKYVLDDVSIWIFPFPTFLAAKFSAFHSRSADARTSQDFEDIIYLLDNRRNFVEDIINAPAEVKTFLLYQFRKMLDQPILKEAILAHLEAGTQMERYELLTSRLLQVINKSQC